MNILKLILDKIFLIVISFSILCFPPLTKLVIANQEKAKISISIRNHILIVEVADTISKKMTGLMYRKELKWDEGMLFIFPTPTKTSFWMKNTQIPLSIAYIDKNGIITDILELKPFDLRGKSSKQKVCYALEVNQNWFKKNEIKVGDYVKGLP